jgi:phytanoyl-CoA hydroxylase
MGNFYHSDFGGMWIDCAENANLLEEKLSRNLITETNFENLKFFIENGYVVFENIIPHEKCDNMVSFFMDSIKNGNPKLIIQSPGEHEGNRRLNSGEKVSNQRIVDSYMVNNLALDILHSPEIIDFLNICFKCKPLLFQSLSFLKGSNQGLHQDTAYVVTDRPMELIASWVALENIVEGSGELEYISKSHRYKEFKFSDKFKHFNPDRDGAHSHDFFQEHLVNQADINSGKKQKFLPNKGDVLLWHADLYHGGATTTNSELTRHSIVGHYCPAFARPNYFNYSNANVYDYSENAMFSSCYYDRKLD